MSGAEAFLRELQEDERGGSSVLSELRRARARKEQERAGPAAASADSSPRDVDVAGGKSRPRRDDAGEGDDGDQPEAEYNPRLCRLEIYQHPERGKRDFTELFQLRPVPSRVMPGGPTLYIWGGLGDGSCMYDSVCFLLNVNGYADHAVRHDVPAMRAIAHEFRCSFTKGLSTKAWREFLLNEVQITPNSQTWEAVVRQRLQDSREDIREDFCNHEVWATEPTARYMARTLNLTIYVIDVSTGRAFCGVHGVNDEDPVVIIFWERGVHFSPGVFVTGLSQGNLQLLGVITDPDLKRRIKLQYEREWCNCASSNSPCHV